MYCNPKFLFTTFKITEKIAKETVYKNAAMFIRRR